jgi:3-methyladenine DNA glycosylase AlkD
VNAAGIADGIETSIAAMPSQDLRAMRGLRREFSAHLKREAPELVLGIALELVQHRRRSHGFVRVMAYELVSARRDAMRALDRGTVEALGDGISSWDEVDAFAVIISGNAWRDGQIDDKTIEAWAGSPDRWWRRAALVSTVPLNLKSRGGVGDAGRTLRICNLLIQDRDDIVVKAMSWALRALAVRDPETVRTYIRKHDSELASRVRREVLTKLDTGVKNRRRADTT